MIHEDESFPLLSESSDEAEKGTARCEGDQRAGKEEEGRARSR